MIKRSKKELWSMIDPVIALGVMTRTQMAILFRRLGKVAEAECLSSEEITELLDAVVQLRQAVVETSKDTSGSIVLGGEVPANKEEAVRELQDIAKELNELVANNCMPEAARKGLRGSLNTIQRLLREI
jgi:hypothetical protein